MTTDSFPVATIPLRHAHTRSIGKRLLALALWTAFGFVCVLGALAVAARPLGFEVFVVRSGSMQPTLGVGDLVVNAPIRARDVRVGDVVTFRDPDDDSRLMTHRVRRVRVGPSLAHFVTRGDANTGVERWSLPVDGKLGRVRFAVPRVGYLTASLGGRFGRLALVVLPALLLGLYELRRIWFPKGRR